MTSTRFLSSIRYAFLLFLAILAARTSAMAAPAATGTWVLADFDGDQKSDLAELRSSSLEFRLSSGLQQNLPLVAGSVSPAMGIVVIDIDGDKDLDIVLQNRFFPQAPQVWLNDGKGSFVATFRFRIPVTFENKSWNHTPAPVFESAVPAKSRESISISTIVDFYRPAVSGFRVYKAPELPATYLSSYTVHLRAPPHPVFF